MKLSEILNGARRIGITGHVRPDGDCVGSVLGLYNYITENMPDIQTDVYLEEPGSEFGYIKNINVIKNAPEACEYDMFFVLDCSSKDRIEPFAACFDAAKKTVCIDHHVSNEGFTDISLIEPEASSTCEVLYKTMEPDRISRSVAECIYTGIIHDTGVFKYSCTSKTTMEIAGEMMEKGIDYSSIIDNSFYAKTYIQNQILGRALLESVVFYDGKCIFSAVTQREMEFYGVTGKELGGIVEQLRLTDGVEVAIFMYEVGENEYKVSMRSKKQINVAAIASEFGGGGHVRAAGYTAKGTVHQIINSIGELIEQQYNAM